MTHTVLYGQPFLDLELHPICHNFYFCHAGADYQSLGQECCFLLPCTAKKTAAYQCSTHYKALPETRQQGGSCQSIKLLESEGLGEVREVKPARGTTTVWNLLRSKHRITVYGTLYLLSAPSMPNIHNSTELNHTIPCKYIVVAPTC